MNIPTLPQSLQHPIKAIAAKVELAGLHERGDNTNPVVNYCRDALAKVLRIDRLTHTGSSRAPLDSPDLELITLITGDQLKERTANLSAAAKNTRRFTFAAIGLLALVVAL